MNYRRLAAYAAIALFGCGAEGATDIPCSTYGQWACLGSEASYCNGEQLSITGSCGSCEVSSDPNFPGVMCDSDLPGRRALLNLPGLPCPLPTVFACSFDRTSVLSCQDGSFKVYEECGSGKRCGYRIVRPGVEGPSCL